MSLQAAAARIGISKAHLSEMENLRSAPSLSVAARIARAYETDCKTIWPNEFTEVTDEPREAILGPLGILTPRQRIDLATVMLVGTGYHAEPDKRIGLRTGEDWDRDYVGEDDEG